MPLLEKDERYAVARNGVSLRKWSRRLTRSGPARACRCRREWCSTLRGGLTTSLVPRKYSLVPNTLDPYPPSDPSGAPGETGTGGGCGTTSELLGLRIGAGGTYGAGGTCADAIPTDKETIASERQQTRAKNMQ